MLKIATLLASTALMAVTPLGSAAHAADIKIGIMVPTTGSEADAGQDMENAVKLAASEVNAKGGVAGNTISTVTGDDACDPQQGATAASKLASSGVTAIVGGYCSGATLPTLKIYGDAGIPFVIVAANSTKIVAANPGNALMINSTGDAQVVTALALFKRLGIKSIALVDQGDAYSSDLAKLTAVEYPKAGGTVAAKETVASGAQDFSSLVSRLQASKAEAIFWTGYYGGGAPLVKQLRQAGVRSKVVLGDANNTPDFLKIAGSAAEGAFILSPPVLEFLPEGAAFKEAYVKAFKRDPGAYAAMSYDATELVFDAIARAGSTDQKAILKALKSSRYEGIAGEIRFAGTNTLEGSNFSVLTDKGGKWVALDK